MAVGVDIWQVKVAFGALEVLKGVDLNIAPGELVTLLGASGSGKSTLLNVVAGLLQADSGDVAFDGRSVQDLAPRDRNIGFLFQSYALFPHLTVAENVAFPLRARHRDKKTQGRVTQQMLDLVHLGEAGGRKVSTLSGGQRQRVALARALAAEPAVLLLDEPMAALDKHLREEMQVEVRRIQRDVGITTISVTHDQTEAMTMSDRIAILREGTLVQVGSPEECYMRPADRFVATFLGEANLVPLTDRAGSGGTAVVRPENYTVETNLAAPAGPYSATGTVRLVSYQGARCRVEVTAETTGELLVASVAGTVDRAGLAPGAPVRLRCLEPDKVHVLT
ncbi:MAG: ABC transporter ATP-binding protein [Bifidobacteriaceae bacterium]|jgi:putative spermidine/putrescine transport system ATP-binding protein|nr:ABC transporter ATP-binding protein [Bifidobacteriaceae bacterium]